MNKTGSEIEQYVYSLVQNYFREEIGGRVYRVGTRPPDSESEDIVVAFIDGINGQFQLSEVTINAYVPDKTLNGKLIKDFQRCAELESMLNEFSHTLPISEFRMKAVNTIRTVQFEEIKQHCVALRLKLTNNTF